MLSLPCGFVTVDLSGVITAAGGDCPLLDGGTPASFIGSEFFETICPEEREQGLRFLETVVVSRRSITLERDQDGRHVAFTLIPADGGDAMNVIMHEVGASLHAERDMQQEQQFMTAILDSLPCAFMVTDSTGRLVRWNGCHRDEFAGKTDAELLGTDAFEIIHPDDRAYLAGKHREVLLNGKEVWGEARVLRQGGPEYCWRQICARQIEVDGTRLVLSVSVDITDRKKTEEALRLSEERFRMLFHGHSAIMLVFDAQSGLIVDANQAAADFYGWSVDELRGMRIHRLNPYPPEVQSGLGDSHGSRKSHLFTFHHLRKDGSIRQVEIAGNRIEIGGVSLIFAIVSDVTERNRWAALTEFRLRLYQHGESVPVDSLLREALDEAEHQTSATFSLFHFLGGIEDGQQQVCSSSLGQSGSSYRDALLRRSIEVSDDWIDAAEHRRTVIRNDFSAPLHEGAIPHTLPAVTRVMIVPVVRGDEVPAMLVVGNKPYPFEPEDALRAEAIADIVWDIVARKRAEMSESRMQGALMQIQKMELIGQLAGGVAHDFNNMLGVIIGNAEMAVAFGEPAAEVLENLNEILLAAERAAKLTDQLLAFARKQPVMPEVVDLNDAVKAIVDMLARLVGEAVVLVWRPCRRAPIVRIDPMQLDQILTNLCLNSRDAIPGTGSITISTGERHLERASYENGAFKAAGDYVVLSIVDTGSGIPKYNLGHIFEPFFTTRAVGKGSGLGLSGVYGIVKQNNGFIEVESETGRGTEFRIFLPRHHIADVDPVQEREGANRPLGQETILLVEDEPEILNICKTVLRKIGYDVLSASSPTEALMLVSGHTGHIDLLLTDVIMPEMNGRELANMIASLHPELKILFMSGYAVGVVAEHGVFDGGNFIQKPFSIRQLADLVRRTLQPQ
ncbi:MAG: PAS domain S-box protein [Chlorobiaceae bacterium]|nr:PAS domain S-box protein [Chlorobiaceae bacterium]